MNSRSKAIGRTSYVTSSARMSPLTVQFMPQNMACEKYPFDHDIDKEWTIHVNEFTLELGLTLQNVSIANEQN